MSLPKEGGEDVEEETTWLMRPEGQIVAAESKPLDCKKDVPTLQTTIPITQDVPSRDNTGETVTDGTVPPPPPPEVTDDLDRIVLDLLESGVWKEAKDGKGRTYFYNAQTKKTVWNLALEVRDTLLKNYVRSPSPPQPEIEKIRSAPKVKETTNQHQDPTASTLTPRKRITSPRAHPSPRIGPQDLYTEAQRQRLLEAKRKRSETRQRGPSIEELSSKAETIQKAIQEQHKVSYSGRNNSKSQSPPPPKSHARELSPSTSAKPRGDAVSEESSSWREKITAIYTKHNPTKLSQLDALLIKYNGKEQELWELVNAKYNLKEQFNTSTAVKKILQQEQQQPQEQKRKTTTPLRSSSTRSHSKPKPKTSTQVKSGTFALPTSCFGSGDSVNGSSNVLSPKSRREAAERKAAAIIQRSGAPQSSWAEELVRRKFEEEEIRNRIKTQKDMHTRKLEADTDRRKAQQERIRQRENEFRAKLMEQKQSTLEEQHERIQHVRTARSSTQKRSTSCPSVGGGVASQRSGSTHIVPFNPALPFDTRSPLVARVNGKIGNLIVQASPEKITPRLSTGNTKKKLTTEEQSLVNARLQRHHSTHETKQLFDHEEGRNVEQ
eukprot:PhF_6_TR27834/c0_g1_i1/m.40612